MPRSLQPVAIDNADTAPSLYKLPFPQSALALFQKRDACGRPVLVLVDNRKMSIQTAETAARIGAGVRKHHRDHHRVAIVLASKLAAIQMRRITLEQRPALFHDEDEAVDWLMAQK